MRVEYRFRGGGMIALYEDRLGFWTILHTPPDHGAGGSVLGGFSSLEKAKEVVDGWAWMNTVEHEVVTC